MDFKYKKECAVCDTPIWERFGAKLKKTIEYNEADVLLDNGTLMTIGVCSKHKHINKEDFPKITHKTHQGWLEEVEFGIGDDTWVKETGLKLTVVGVK